MAGPTCLVPPNAWSYTIRNKARILTSQEDDTPGKVYTGPIRSATGPASSPYVMHIQLEQVISPPPGNLL